MATKNQTSSTSSSGKTSGTETITGTGTGNKTSTGLSGSSTGLSGSSKTSTSQSNGSSTGKTGTSKTSSSKTGTNGNSSMTENDHSLSAVFINGLKEIYNAEKQLIKALPKMAEAASDEELKDAIEHHLEQTKKQAERLEKIFSRLRIDREEKTCAVMQSLLEEGQKTISEYEEGPVRDAALIIGAQKIEHHEIAVYGSLCELAEVLGYHKISDILDRSLEEEEEADHLLTEIAQDINDEAVEAEDEQYMHA